MSTNYQTSDPSVTVTRFYGGQTRGLCVQITATGFPGSGPTTNESHNSVLLTQAQARALLADLGGILALAYFPGQDAPELEPCKPSARAERAALGDDCREDDRRGS